MEQISYGHLLELAKSKNTGIFDTRSSNAYIGWLVDGAKKRGHIQGSRLMSADWIYYMEEAILSILEERRKSLVLEHRIKTLIQAYDTIVLYDSGEGQSKTMYEYIVGMSSAKIYYFNLNDYEGSLEAYPNYHLLVPPEWIMQKIEKEEKSKYQIVECSWGSENIVFEASHIPGAIHLDTDEFEKEPEWVHRPIEDLKKMVVDNGLKKDMTVIFYSSGDQGAEFKSALILELIGFKDVRVMNGNYSQWRLRKYPVEHGIVGKPENGELLSDTKLISEEKLTSISQIKEILSNPKSRHQVVDIRQWLERSAQESGYKHIPKAGRIPNTVYGDSWYLYKNIDETIRDDKDIYQILKNQNINPNSPMHFFCGSAGWGASIVEKYFRVFGNVNAKIYEGGWGEWQLDPNNILDQEVLSDSLAPSKEEAFLEVEQ